MKIFIHRDGEVSGPFGRVEIFAGLQKGTFASEDAACLEGSDEWKPLQQLLTGKLGVAGKGAVPTPLDVAIPSDPESIGTPLPLEPIQPEPMHWMGDLSAGPTLVRRPQDDQSEPFAKRHQDLAVTCALFGLLFFVAMALSLVIGRSRFLHRANVVAIETSRTSSKQKIESNPPLPASSTPAPLNADLYGRAGSVAGEKLVAAPTPDLANQVNVASAVQEDGPAAATPKQAAANISVPPHVESSNASSSENEQRTTVENSGDRKLFEIPRISPRELVEVLGDRFSSNPVNAAASNIKEDPNLTFREGSFMLDTSLQWNPRVEIVYSIPLYKNVTPGPNASNIVMTANFPPAMAPPKETLVNGKLVRERSGHYGRMYYYVHKLGYTAFSMHCVTKSMDDPEETYFLGGPQWVDLVFRAQDELTRMFKLQPRKLMMTSTSVGASFVEKVAAARPDKVAAIAILNAPEVSVPKQPSDTLWYLQINRGDSMQAQYNMLYNALMSQNAKVLFDIFPPYYGRRGKGNMYHTDTDLNTEASEDFLAGIGSARDAAGNIDPSKWPFVRDQDHPYMIMTRNSPELARIAPAKRLLLPSAKMARCVQSLPVPLQAVMLPQLDGKLTKCFVGIPPVGRPRGTLVYAPEASYRSITDMFNDIYFLSEKGYLVLCPYSLHTGDTTLAATLSFVQNTPLLKGVPLVLVGVGERANQLWADISKSSLSPSAMALLKFKPRDLFDESNLTLESHPIRFPVLFVEDEAQVLKVSTPAEAKEKLAEARQIDAYVAKCRERHQVSRVILIPASDDSEERNAQKTVEVINDSFADLVEGHRGTILK